MPRVKVGNKVKHFPYTSVGKKAATSYAKKTGGKMTDKSLGKGKVSKNRPYPDMRKNTL